MNKKLWTPGGDVPVGDEQPQTQQSPGPDRAAQASSGPEGQAQEPREPTEEEMRAYLEQLRAVPVRDVIVNQAVSLYQVAAVHLQPDELDEAALAIDAFEGLIDAVGDRFGTAKPELDQILTQLRLDFVTVQNAAGVAPNAPASDSPD